MGYVEPEPEKHSCPLPKTTAFFGIIALVPEGRAWECDECGKRWVSAMSLMPVQHFGDPAPTREVVWKRDLPMPPRGPAGNSGARGHYVQERSRDGAGRTYYQPEVRPADAPRLQPPPVANTKPPARLRTLTDDAAVTVEQLCLMGFRDAEILEYLSLTSRLAAAAVEPSVLNALIRLASRKTITPADIEALS